MVTKGKHDVWKQWKSVLQNRGMMLHVVYQNLSFKLDVVKGDETEQTHYYLAKSSLFVE